MDTAVLAYFSPGPVELIVVALLALLLFGKRLPEVARNLGKGIIEFKKGVRGIEDEVNSATYDRPSSTPRPDAEDNEQEWTAPKFEPPDSEPSEPDTKQTD
jgi:sec-independent protein translocase protein TatA